MSRHHTPRVPAVGTRAPRIEGSDLSGGAAVLDASAGRLVLVFLTSSCQPCQAVWKELPAAAGSQVAVVTPGSGTESRRAVAQLAPSSVRVLMSSDAWFDYGVRAAPWVVEIEAGTIVAEGRPLGEAVAWAGAG